MLVSRETEIYLIAGARTPFGTYGGSLKTVDAATLGIVAAQGAIAKSGIPVEDVDLSVVGNVLPSNPDFAYMARHIALPVGIPEASPSLTVNRLCGSGLQAVVSAAQSLVLGEGQVALAGGTENMSQAPYALRDARWGLKVGVPALDDTLQQTLTDLGCGLGMGMTAENLADAYGISREAQDAHAMESHRRAATARIQGIFSEEIVPVEMTLKGQTRVVDQDEHIRPDTTLERLAALRPTFRQEGGTVTAGNASGINDGAAMCVLATGDYVAAHGIRPLARIMSYAVVGVDPRVMGIGPVPASRLALERAGLEVDEIGRIEVNEAFSAQYLAVEKELGLSPDRTNVHGGAVALGHPVGASGARLLLTLALSCRRDSIHYGLAALCIGGGQGIAMVIETV